MNLNEHTKGLLMTFIAVLILSPDALLVRLIRCDLWSLLFWRCLLTGGMMTLFLVVRYRQGFWRSFRTIGLAGWLSAGVLTCGSLLFVSSLKETSAANTLVILAATPMFSSLLSRIFLKDRIALRTWLAIVTCFGGILLIFSGSLKSGMFLGDLLALGATTMWAINLVVLRQAKAVNMIPASVLGNLLVVPVVLLLGARPMSISVNDLSYILILGGVVLPVSFALITLSPRFLPAPEISLILLTETMLGPIWVWLVLDEAPQGTTLIAGVLIIFTLSIHTLLMLKEQRLHFRVKPARSY